LPSTLRTTDFIALRDNTVNWERLNQFKHLNQSLDQVIKTQRYGTMHNEDFFFQAFVYLVAAVLPNDWD